MKQAIRILLLSWIVLSCSKSNSTMESFYYFTQGDRPGSETPYGNNTSIGKYVQADDVKIYYETYGEGKPLYVLHGGGVGTPYEMGQLIDSLRGLGMFKVFVISTRGHGRSELGHKKMSLEQRAIDLSEVINHLSPGEKVSFVGFSDGAYSAMSVAVHHPELVERIVAIGAGTVKAGYMAADAKVSDWEKYDKRFCDQQRSIMPEPDRWQEFLTDYMSYWNTLNLREEFFSRIQCPVLLMVGDEDDHAPLQTVVDAYYMAPSSRLSIIPKAWHTCFMDNFPATWNSMKRFVQENIDELQGSRKVYTSNPSAVSTIPLLRSSESWDGMSLPDYPKGKPELLVNQVIIPPHSELGWHHHEMMSYGIVTKGALTLVKRDTGEERTIHAGEAVIETVGSIHRGENRGDVPVEVTVFYISKEGATLSVPD